MTTIQLKDKKRPCYAITQLTFGISVFMITCLVSRHSRLEPTINRDKSKMFEVEKKTTIDNEQSHFDYSRLIENSKNSKNFSRNHGKCM